MKDFFYKLKWRNNLEVADAIANLKMHNHIPEYITCTDCGSEMSMHRDSSRSDSFRWVCRRCRKRKPIRHRTWTAKYRVPLMALLMVVRYYVEEKPVEITAQRTLLDILVCKKIYKDLDANQGLYAKKMHSILSKEIENAQIIDKIKDKHDNFRFLSQFFPLHSVYKIVLESLSQNIDF